MNYLWKCDYGRSILLKTNWFVLDSTLKVNSTVSALLLKFSLSGTVCLIM